MRRFVAVLGVVLVSGAVPGSAEERTLKLFEWLAGVWESAESSRMVEEHWTTPTANLMIGMSRTIAENRTAEFEFLRIERRGDDLFYVPQPGGRPPVAFKLTSANDGRFVFENTSGEDRVHRIEYRREGGDGLTARVEGARGNKPFVLEYRYRRRK
jgi:hypothetical protein